MAEGEMKHSRETGEWTYWYENQLIEEGEIAEGYKEGVWKTYFFGSGALMSETTFEKGVESGLVKYCFEDGLSELEGEMAEGKRGNN